MNGAKFESLQREGLAGAMEAEELRQPKLLVWTLRRTGGTTLQKILRLAYDPSRVLAEPFNWDRTFGSLSKRFATGGTPAELYEGLLPYLDRPVVIKHCLELMDQRHNASLISISVLQEFKHVILYRKNELNRIKSLIVSLSTGFWGQSSPVKYDGYLQANPSFAKPVDFDKVMATVDYGITQLRAVTTALSALGIKFVEIRLEDVHSDNPEAAVTALESKLTEAGLDLSRVRRKALLGRVERGNQRSGQLLRWVPNAKDFEGLEERRPDLADITARVRGAEAGAPADALKAER